MTIAAVPIPANCPEIMIAAVPIPANCPEMTIAAVPIPANCPEMTIVGTPAQLNKPVVLQTNDCHNFFSAYLLYAATYERRFQR